MLISLSNSWLQIQLTHHVSLEATNAFWRTSLKSFHELIEKKKAEGINRKIPQYVQIRKNIYKDICPDVKMSFAFLNKNDNTIVKVSADQTPLTEYQRDPRYVKLYEEAHIEIKDLKKIHYWICEDHSHNEPIIQLSLDGVQESRSSLTSLDTFSLKFNHCRNIYPFCIIRPCGKYKYDEQAEIERVLKDINENDIVIDCAVLDKPKRSTVLCEKGHSAKFPCEYCENCAVTHLSQNKKSKKDNELNKSGKKQLTWPSSTMSGTQRTLESIRAIVTEIENNPDILKNDAFCKGIKGKSLLLYQPSFNMIRDVPCEYMHLVCLGVIKRLIENTFKVGENRERLTKRKLTNPQVFNQKIRDIQSTREFGRRCRNLDFSTMKAAEFRNLLLFFFPIVIDCIEDDFPKEKQIWLHLVFMIRACVIPNNEFRNVNDDDVKSACKKFYVLYEKAFGPTNCTYSIHVSGSHLLQVRDNRPLTHKSAFKFESFFAEMKNLFHPGTVSPLKQILQNCFVKRLLEYHTCEKETFYSAEKKPTPGKKFNPGKENNHLIYTFNEDHMYSMYIIDEIIDKSSFRCKIQGKFKMKIQLTPEYDWSHVGVFKVGAISEELVIVNRKDIAGKVIKVNEFLITCPYNVLHEQ